RDIVGTKNRPAVGDLVVLPGSFILLSFLFRFLSFFSTFHLESADDRPLVTQTMEGDQVSDRLHHITMARISRPRRDKILQLLQLPQNTDILGS
ncbi:hypothetical protein BDW42DRAFT_159222, partial [Aspergillus taichungensis]